MQNAPQRGSGKALSLSSLAGLVAAALLPLTAAAAPETCESAAVLAAREYGIPVDLMQAIALAESGRRLAGVLRPWPWAVNEGGKGQWFDSRQTAEAYVRNAVESGTRNIDVGCFQLNHRWHGHKFQSISQMFDPVQNARYAAAFLAELYRSEGDWRQAVGAYHSRTRERAADYATRIETLRAGLPDLPAQQPRPAALNRFPLLQAGGRGAAGSLVPTLGGAGRLVVGAANRLIGG